MTECEPSAGLVLEWIQAAVGRGARVKRVERITSAAEMLMKVHAVTLPSQERSHAYRPGSSSPSSDAHRAKL